MSLGELQGLSLPDVLDDDGDNDNNYICLQDVEHLFNDINFKIPSIDSYSIGSLLQMFMTCDYFICLIPFISFLFCARFQ